MFSSPEEFRQRLLIDVMLLRDHHDRIGNIAQALPVGELRSNLQLAHQNADQLTLQLRKTLMEMA
jgi:hypothetical protein